MDENNAYILGLSSNFLHILQNIPTVFGITRGGTVENNEFTRS